MEIKNLKYLCFILVFNLSFKASSETISNGDFLIQKVKPEYIEARELKKYKSIDYKKLSTYELLIDSTVYKIERIEKDKTKNTKDLNLKIFKENAKSIPKYTYRLSSKNEPVVSDSSILNQDLKLKPINSYKVLLINKKVKFSNGTLIASFINNTDFNDFAVQNNLQLIRTFPSLNKAVYKHPDFNNLENDIRDLNLNNSNFVVEFGYIDPDIVAE